ncbi:MAG: hypothetical protein ACOH2C_02750 [Clostridium sp.]
MSKLLKSKYILVFEEEFHCRSKFSKFHKERPNSEDLALAKEFARQIVK